ncbi:MAG: hypothetical protein K0R08_567 [Solimicrobium sp.]|jgi:hypothetical protein|nr:hypothetical protein [Solimicrobium sp.]
MVDKEGLNNLCFYQKIGMNGTLNYTTAKKTALMKFVQGIASIYVATGSLSRKLV